MPTYSYEEAYESSLEYFNGKDLAAKIFVDKYALAAGVEAVITETTGLLDEEDLDRYFSTSVWGLAVVFALAFAFAAAFALAFALALAVAFAAALAFAFALALAVAFVLLEVLGLLLAMSRFAVVFT